MLTEEILTYIKQNLQAGFSHDDIKSSLMASGWSEADVEAGFSAVGKIERVGLERMPVRESPDTKEVEIVEDSAPMSELQKQTNAEVKRFEEMAEFQNIDQSKLDAKDNSIWGFMIRNNLANNKQSAQVLLATAGFTLLIVVYWLFLH